MINKFGEETNFVADHENCQVLSLIWNGLLSHQSDQTSFLLLPQICQSIMYLQLSLPVSRVPLTTADIKRNQASQNDTKIFNTNKHFDMINILPCQGVMFAQLQCYLRRFSFDFHTLPAPVSRRFLSSLHLNWRQNRFQISLKWKWRLRDWQSNDLRTNLKTII